MKKHSVIVLPDIHVPEHDPKALNAVCKYIGNHNVNEVVMLGDMMSMDCMGYDEHGLY